MSTAGHCYDFLTWGGTSNVIAFDHTAARASNGDVDLQFHKDVGSNVSENTFWATGTSSSDIRSVTSRQNATQGDYVCKFGGYGGYRCPILVTGTNDYVDGYDSEGVFRHYIGLAVMGSANNVAGGDSGGPVFSGGVAYGSITARLNDGSAAWYTPQTRWGENLNASILTN